MREATRERDLAAEENERLSFIILQHVYSLDPGEGMETSGEGELLVGRVAADLGLPASRAVQLVAHLTYAEFLSWEGTGRPVRITAKGNDYIERLAHRRRSLRVMPSGDAVR